jgi:hypothetical protein
MLSDTAVRNAKPRKKPYELTDRSGGTSTSPNRSGWWRFRYRVEGREKLNSLGTYRVLPLREHASCGMKLRSSRRTA